METWFCKPKTDSLLTLRSEATVPAAPPPRVEPSFFLVPDGVVGDCQTDECHLVTRFLSAIAGHIMESAFSVDCTKTIPIPRPPTPPEIVEVGSDKNFVSEGRKMTILKKRMDDIMEEEEEQEQETEELVTVLERKPSKAPSEGTAAVDRLASAEETSAMESAVETFEDEDSIKKPEVTTKRKRYPSTMELDRVLASSVFQELDQMADIVFTNNNRYQGRLSRMRMEGMGLFTWNNGQTYKGTFKNNRPDGLGEITWIDGSTYEGQVKDGVRHGKGVKTYMGRGINGEHVRMHHSGEWKNGKKHGQGKTVYGENDWYDGEWHEGRKNGYGIRQYPSGVRYEGEWFYGHRQGTGTMVWPNCDVYNGQWEWGYMEGWGKYTWGGTFSDNLVAPLSNSYSGYWSRGKREGLGVLELATGATISGHWDEGLKFGTANVVRRNGDRFVWSKLFEWDQVLERDLTPSELECSATKIEMATFDEEEPTIKKPSSLDSVPRTKVAQTVPINVPVATMDFTLHIARLFTLTPHTILPLTINDYQPPRFPIEEKAAVTSLESYWLKKIVTRHMKNLTRVYNFYALIFHSTASPTPPPNYLSEQRVVLLRFMLWELLKNCGLSETPLNAYQMDQEVGAGFDPLDKVTMPEMIHYLLTLSWYLYARKRLKNPTIPGILGASFDVFMEKVVIGSTDRYDGNCLKLLKHVPLEPLYKLYKTFNQPILIEDFCERVVYLPKKSDEHILPVTTDYFRYVLLGKNVIGADGYLKYIAHGIPDFDYEKMKLPRVPIKMVDFNVLGIIGMDSVVSCIQKVVPAIALESETKQPKSDYELSFVEFCEILAHMALVYVDLGEQFCTQLKFQQEEAERAEKAERERIEALKKKEEALANETKAKRKSQAAAEELPEVTE